jgi:hypothetical protein
MKTILLVLVMLVSTMQAQTVTCTLSKHPLINSFTYTCDDQNQQPVWSVIYYQNQLWVVIVNPANGQVAGHVPVKFRSQSTDFLNDYNTLHVWTTKDMTGKWIQMQGTTGPR